MGWERKKKGLPFVYLVAYSSPKEVWGMGIEEFVQFQSCHGGEHPLVGFDGGWSMAPCFKSEISFLCFSGAFSTDVLVEWRIRIPDLEVSSKILIHLVSLACMVSKLMNIDSNWKIPDTRDGRCSSSFWILDIGFKSARIL